MSAPRKKKKRENPKPRLRLKKFDSAQKTNEHHRGFKTRDARRCFRGKQVKVTIRFRGREITYPEIALEDLKVIAAIWLM
jgi:translation initiation factor IF-3